MRLFVIDTPCSGFTDFRKTLSIGFPNSDTRWNLKVYHNQDNRAHDKIMEETFWYYDYDEPLLFLDPDVVFFSNIESKLLAIKSHWLAGNFIPNYYNTVVDSNEIKRYHTSLLYLPKPQELKKYLSSIEQCQNYPFNAFAPFIYYLSGRKFFYDTGANLYNAVPLERKFDFSESILNSYSHLGCSTMLDLVRDKIPNGDRLRHIHEDAKSGKLELLRNLWKEQTIFYRSNPPRL